MRIFAKEKTGHWPVFLCAVEGDHFNRKGREGARRKRQMATENTGMNNAGWGWPVGRVQRRSRVPGIAAPGAALRA
ncbi:MAG: hypothetical protein WCZ87_06400 [Thiohalobacteraceae bacterium]